MNHITVRYLTGPFPEYPPFSARSFRALSSGGLTDETAPSGFIDIKLPITGSTLAQAIYLSGLFQPPALCSGIGRCGLCRVRYISDPPPVLDTEKDALSHHDLDSGWRLACRRAPEPGTHVLLPARPIENAATPTNNAPQNTFRCGLAVDLGTTSLHWRFVPLDAGEMQKSDSSPCMPPEPAAMPHGAMPNPQMGAGSDVVSRLEHAATPKGAETLRRLVANALTRIVAQGAQAGFIVKEMCLAANPAMAAILLGLDVSSLSRAPYSLPHPGGNVADIPGLPPVYMPPHISPFVGADAVAGYAAIAMNPDADAPEYPFLLADLGTNGECVLALSPDESLTASLPMGPALEGVNLAFGMEAVPGAITEYALTPLGLEPKVMGDTAPSGISATGYLSLLRALRATGVMTEEGMFSHAKNPLAKRAEGEHAATNLRLPGKMVLYASDVEEILKVKAAFSLAVSRLLREASLPAAALRGIRIAGSLGSHAPANALTDLGFLPPGTGKKIIFQGNAALAGAALLLSHKTLRPKLAAWAKNAVAVNLAGDPSFGEAYAKHMVFAWRS